MGGAESCESFQQLMRLRRTVEEQHAFGLVMSTGSRLPGCVRFISIEYLLPQPVHVQLPGRRPRLY